MFLYKIATLNRVLLGLGSRHHPWINVCCCLACPMGKLACQEHPRFSLVSEGLLWGTDEA